MIKLLSPYEFKIVDSFYGLSKKPRSLESLAAGIALSQKTIKQDLDTALEKL